MTTEQLYYTLALLRLEGVGDITAKKLIHHCGSAEQVFLEKKATLQKIDGVGDILIKKLKDKSVFEKATNELDFIARENIQTLYYQEDNYPERLKHCIDAPLLLFQSGKVDWQNKRIISVVGTRQITSAGTAFCKKFIEDIAPLNPIIVSGFAYGVDIAAHQFAMENNLQTIGVLAHGLNQIYPADHKKYMAKMEENGGFLTEFWSTSKPDRENFVRRNRIVAGISEATVVIESAEKGGSLITPKMANEYNRDVFAVPGRVTDKYSIGCNNLIKIQQANLLTSAADLVYILGWDVVAKKEKIVQKQLFITLEAEEQKIYDFLLQNGKESLDEIAITCDVPTYKLSSILLNMELKGVVRPLPGKMFEAI